MSSWSDVLKWAYAKQGFPLVASWQPSIAGSSKDVITAISKHREGRKGDRFRFMSRAVHIIVRLMTEAGLNWGRIGNALISFFCLHFMHKCLPNKWRKMWNEERRRRTEAAEWNLDERRLIASINSREILFFLSSCWCWCRFDEKEMEEYSKSVIDTFYAQQFTMLAGTLCSDRKSKCCWLRFLLFCFLPFFACRTFKWEWLLNRFFIWFAIRERKSKSERRKMREIFSEKFFNRFSSSWWWKRRKKVHREWWKYFDRKTKICCRTRGRIMRNRNGFAREENFSDFCREISIPSRREDEIACAWNLNNYFAKALFTYLLVA